MDPNFELFDRGKNEYKQTYMYPLKKHPKFAGRVMKIREKPSE